MSYMLSDGVLVWLSVWSEVQIVCIWSSWCHCHPKTPSSIASFKSRLVLSSWYRLTQVVLEKTGVVVVVVVEYWLSWYRCRVWRRSSAEQWTAGLLREAQLHPGSEGRGLRRTCVGQAPRQHCGEAGLPEFVDRYVVNERSWPILCWRLAVFFIPVGTGVLVQLSRLQLLWFFSKCRDERVCMRVAVSACLLT